MPLGYTRSRLAGGAEFCKSASSVKQRDRFDCLAHGIQTSTCLLYFRQSPGPPSLRRVKAVKRALLNPARPALWLVPLHLLVHFHV